MGKVNSEQIKNSIEIAAYDLNQNAVVDFADQLAVANELAEQVQSKEDLESLQQPLFNHSDKHMRRLGSLSLLNLPYIFYPQAAGWAEKYLQDDFKWVRYDAVRFFHVNATPDERIIQCIGALQTQDSDLLKVIGQLQTAALEIKYSYQEALLPRDHANVKLRIPGNWVTNTKSKKAVLYATPELESLKHTKIKHLSTLHFQVIPNLTPKEIAEMVGLNMELARDLNTELDGYEIGKTDTRIIYTSDPPDNFPFFMVREFIYNTSTLVVATVTAPLAHIELALPRNLAILDSFEIE